MYINLITLKSRKNYIGDKLVTYLVNHTSYQVNNNRDHVPVPHINFSSKKRNKTKFSIKIIL